MHRGRYERQTPVCGKCVRRRKLNKYFLVTLSLILLLVIAGGTTLAYVVAGGGPVSNSFTPGAVSCSVESDYAVKNTGNVAAYIRAAVIVNWENNAGEMNGIAPVVDKDYLVTLVSGWTLNTDDGYYYYSGKLPADGKTSPVCTVTPLTDAPDGFFLSVEILAEAIQAEGMGADSAQDVWEKALGISNG